MRKSAKIITALSVSGLAVVAGSAFTGAGLTASGDAANAQFIGGTVSQTVEGAVLADIVYSVTTPDTAVATQISGATVTFADDIAAGSEVKVRFVPESGSEVTKVCTAVDVAGTPSLTEFNCALGTPMTSLASTFVTVKATANIA